MTARPWNKPWRLLVLALPALMSACAAPPTISATACPQPPPKPRALQPLPPQSYSESAAADIERWQQQLMATLPTSPSATPPGRSDGNAGADR